MKLNQLLNVDKLQEHLKSRVVNVQAHHFCPLLIYNYGQKAQFEGIWDDVTVHTRGLIVDKNTQEIIARPFQKFFNLGHVGRPETNYDSLPASLPEITEKLDGSLGILYRHNGFTGVATRGSFASDQAAWASAWYNRNLPKAVWPVGWTPLFEIVYPDNRIVVKYDWEGLTLLGVVNNDTGEEYSRDGLKELAQFNGCRLVPLFNKTVEDVRTENVQNAEGYVCTWHRGAQPPLKVKVKFVDYCRLHRLLTCISPKAIWEMLRDGSSLDELLTDVPSHYMDWVNYWKNGLQAEYGRIEQRAKAVFAGCPHPKDANDREARKRVAEHFTRRETRDISSVLFKMLDGLPYDEVIWRMVREKTRDQEPFKRDGE
jgi:hypothetical protein